MTVQLGQNVVYLSAKGQQKAALVIGTPASIEEGTSVPQPEEGHLNLKVFAPNGNEYVKYDVPPASDEAQEQVYVLPA